MPNMPPPRFNQAQMTVAVTPTPFVKPTVNIAKVQVRIMNVNLFTSVNICAVLMDNNNETLDSKTFFLQGTDYTNWGNDDNYIINYALTKLGLTTLDAVVVPVPA
jgi:hypothetical protein